MQQVRQGMHDDMRKLKGYSDEWRLIAKEQPEQKLGFRRFIDGSRNQMAVMMDGNAVMESGYDGKDAWMVFHPGKLYADEPFKYDPDVDKAEVDAPRTPRTGLSISRSTARMTFRSGRSLTSRSRRSSRSNWTGTTLVR